MNAEYQRGGEMRAQMSAIGRVFGVVGLMAAMLLSFAPRVHAQADADATARARRLYGEAQGLFDRGQFAQAEVRFRAAYEAVPNPVVLRAIAAAQERQGNTTGAAESYRAYLEASPEASDRAEVEATIREIEARPSTMTINSTPPGAQVVLDGTDSQQRTPSTLQIAGGEHQLELHLEGYSPHRQAFTAQPGARARLDITLQPGQDEPVGSGGNSGGGGGGSADPSIGVWVLAGVAAAGLVSGTAFGFVALSEQSSFDDQPDADTADRGETFALIADISFGVAAAAAITGIVLYIVEASGGDSDSASLGDDDLRLDVGGWADNTGGGAAATLTF
ncbi:MAG: PEGA domain-containing protein [Sandaracinaceae bacterium]